MDGKEKKAVSLQKIAANRLNSQRSTGPRTPLGKKRSSQNARKYGYYSRRLFPSGEQSKLDRKDFKRILAGILEHFNPVGFLENFTAEEIAAAMLRSLRFAAYEQQVINLSDDEEFFASPSIVLRQQATINREIDQALKQLERLQKMRRESHPYLESEMSGLADEQNEQEARAEFEELQIVGRGPSTDCEMKPIDSCEAAPPVGQETPLIESCDTNPTRTHFLDPEKKENRDGQPDFPSETGVAIHNAQTNLENQASAGEESADSEQKSAHPDCETDPTPTRSSSDEEQLQSLVNSEGVPKWPDF